MTPLSFDPATAREVVGDGVARALEEKARADAEAGTFLPPPVEGDSYWGQVQAQMGAIVYREQYTRRLARLERKAESGNMKGT